MLHTFLPLKQKRLLYLKLLYVIHKNCLQPRFPGDVRKAPGVSKDAEGSSQIPAEKTGSTSVRNHSKFRLIMVCQQV